MIYNTGSGGETIESAEFSQGRIIFSSSTAHTTLYHHRDHLGSIRAITDGAGTVVEQNDYYPFGGRHSYGNTYLQTTANRYKFNGKEVQTTVNLGLLDYGVRMYDPVLGRWTAQDPLSEKYYSWSQYNYCGAKPVIRIDSEGKFWETAWDATSFTMGLKSLRDNIRQVKIGASIADGIGVLLDAAAVLTPFVPGGVSAAISAARAVDRVDDIVDAVKALRPVKPTCKKRKSTYL